MLVETFLLCQKTFDTEGLAFSVSFMNFSVVVELKASAVSVKLTLEGDLVSKVQDGRPSHFNSSRKLSLNVVLLVSAIKVIFSSWL